MSVGLYKIGMKDPKSWRFVTQIWVKIGAIDCKLVSDETPESLVPETEALVWETEWKRKWISAKIEIKNARGNMDCSVLKEGLVDVGTWRESGNDDVDKDCKDLSAPVLVNSAKQRRILWTSPRATVVKSFFSKLPTLIFDGGQTLYLTSHFVCYFESNKSKSFVLTCSD